VTSIGRRPTFGGADLTVESYLLEAFDGQDPRRIRVEYLWRMREEHKFADAESLKAQILRDVSRARAYWRRVNRIGWYTQKESQIPR
jgi:riboflavin kinase/FMN adenylyltransferase